MFIGATPAILRPSVLDLWTPKKLPGLVAWWDASDTANVTLSSGSSVQSWRDKIGGIVLSQATTSKQPTWSAGARNGKPGVTFNANAEQFLSGPQNTLPSGNNVSTIAVAAYGTGSTLNGAFFSYGSSRPRILGFGNNSDSVWAANLEFDDKPGPSWNQFDRFVNWNFAPQQSSTISIDGVDYASSSSNRGTEAGDAMMGSIVNFTFVLPGVTQQTLVFNQILSKSDQQKLQGWESWTDGKAGLNLPSGHPYKSAPPPA